MEFEDFDGADDPTTGAELREHATTPDGYVLPRVPVIAAITQIINESLNTSVLPIEPLFIEVLYALRNIYCVTATRWLSEAESVEEFVNNRHLVTQALGVASAYVSGMVPESQVLQGGEDTTVVN